ncbi:Isochorismatase-like [Lasallia pustulata]|uniref:Isochorismatase-like n=1 Tax=Lasallia pustulata TaxID=136370 RepID=A0A1W5CVE4_9LECA|nr:Isochorismatase-like [Lasallia pustulata]
MPPGTRRAFGFEVEVGREAEREAADDAYGVNQAAVEEALRKREEGGGDGKTERIYRGLGSEMGIVRLGDGEVVDAGRLLMRGAWNASLPPALMHAYREGAKLEWKPDVWIHKNRMSGLWGGGTPCTEFLEKEGITSLLFTGVNTDQCVSGSLQDAFSKGYDCILIRDGCGTTSPKSASEGIEFNCERTWGFVADCKDLEDGVERMLEARTEK